MINVDIKDVKACEKINEENIHNYLKSHGFEFYQKRPYGYEYRRSSCLAISVVFAERQAADFGRRVLDLIRSISQMEGRSQLDIFVELGGEL